LILKEVPLGSWLDLLRRRVYLKRFGVRLGILSFLDLLVIKEVVADDEYRIGGLVDKVDKIIVDIGAGLGDYAILVAMRFPESVIYSFEPDINYFNLLRNNIVRNGAYNVVPINAAISSLNDLFTHTHTDIDVLKIDCEGCEFSILNNMSIRYLKRVKKITMEYHKKFGDERGVIGMLKSSGFKITQVLTDGVPELGHIYAQRK